MAGVVAMLQLLILRHPTFAQERIGPSFDCASAASRNQPLAQVICSSDDLSSIELMYVIAYQAARQSVDESGKQTLAKEAATLVTSTTGACGIPITGHLTRDIPKPMTSCVRSSLENARRDLVHRLTGEALQEAHLKPSEAKEIQQALKNKWFLDADADVDGVFGPATRRAILQWQRTTGHRETGFASREMLGAQTLSAPSPQALGSQNAQTTPRPPAVQSKTSTARVRRVGPSYDCGNQHPMATALRRIICANDDLAWLQLIIASAYPQMAPILNPSDRNIYTLAQSERRIENECRLQSTSTYDLPAVQCIARILARDIKGIEQFYQSRDRQLRSKLDSSKEVLNNSNAQAGRYAKNGQGQLLRREQEQIQRYQQELATLSAQHTALNESWRAVATVVGEIQSQWELYQRQVAADKMQADEEMVRVRTVEAARLRAIEDQARAQAEIARIQAEAETQKRADEERRKKEADEAEQKRITEEREKDRLGRIASLVAKVDAGRRACKPVTKPASFLASITGRSTALKAGGEMSTPLYQALTALLPYALDGKDTEVSTAMIKRVVAQSQMWKSSPASQFATQSDDFVESMQILQRDCFFEMIDYLASRNIELLRNEVRFVLGYESSTPNTELASVVQLAQPNVLQRALSSGEDSGDVKYAAEEKRLRDEEKQRRVDAQHRTRPARAAGKVIDAA